MKTYEDKDYDSQMKEIPDYAEDDRQRRLAEDEQDQAHYCLSNNTLRQVHRAQF